MTTLKNNWLMDAMLNWNKKKTYLTRYHFDDAKLVPLYQVFLHAHTHTPGNQKWKMFIYRKKKNLPSWPGGPRFPFEPIGGDRNVVKKWKNFHYNNDDLLEKKDENKTKHLPEGPEGYIFERNRIFDARNETKK